MPFKCNIKCWKMIKLILYLFVFGTIILIFNLYCTKNLLVEFHPIQIERLDKNQTNPQPSTYYGWYFVNGSYRVLPKNRTLNENRIKRSITSFIVRLTKLNGSKIRDIKLPVHNSEKLKSMAHFVETNRVDEISRIPLIPPALRISFPFYWNGLRLPILTKKPEGRLGNAMNQYAILFAFGILYNVTVLLHPLMKESLQHFPHLSMPELPPAGIHKHMKNIFRSGIWNYASNDVAAAGLFGPYMFLLQGWPCELGMINLFKERIFKEFRFSDQILQQATRNIEDIKKINYLKTKSRDVNLTFVGFHIRRTDYAKRIHNWGGKLPDYPFYERAMTYYRQKYSNVIFVVSSDSLLYAKKILQSEDDVVFVPEGQPRELDMATLTCCNHSIFTIGSFGFWTSFLTGGEVVFADINTTRGMYRFSRAEYEAANLSFVPIKP